MKKVIIAAAFVVFLGSILTSCKSSAPHCQAYSKADKVKTDRTEKSI